MDIHLLRCQQLRLYILKAARALLSHQDKLRQILSQPAVVDIGPNPSGKASPSAGFLPHSDKTEENGSFENYQVLLGEFRNCAKIKTKTKTFRK